ncbi:hypothetical protein [Lysinibacillus sphaericus]|uniref:hypothetical protein n=1 Tax=Lysinibacillus sphaericus TaxID=1421 RepID=UPI00069082FF|nr:hypothetical protein [Lysinibacillus sphaericus]
MPTETANYGFTKDNEDEFYNVNVVNDNLDKIDTEMKRIEDTIPTISPTDSIKWLGTVAGTANALTVTHAAITSYSDGLGVSFAANANSSAATTININTLGAIPIKKANGTAVTNLKAGGVYTVRYRAGAFILQGEGGAGNAIASDLLSGKTASTDAGDIVGTMPNRGAPTITPTTSDQAIAPGYYSGGTIKAYQQERIQSSITVPSGGKAYVPQPWGNGTVGAYTGRVLTALSHGRTPNYNDVAIAYSLLNREPSYLAGSRPAQNHSVTLDNTNIVFSSNGNETFDYVLTKYTGV